MKDTKLIDLFQTARKNEQRAVVEGIQALKHAVRFNAAIEIIVTSDLELLKELTSTLAGDTAEQILSSAILVSEEVFGKLSPQPPRTKVIALAARKNYKFSDISNQKPIIFIENPRDLENIGAVIRVAAAADAGAVVCNGPVDVWHPAVIRGAAGLQYALPVFNAPLELIKKGRELVALDPTGEPIAPKLLQTNAIFIFGTERHGITEETLQKSDQILRLPMKQGVSSLNLATSVAATLYMM
jgi:TrmH family RNA methyltransferase